jgi:hypothetical protein
MAQPQNPKPVMPAPGPKAAASGNKPQPAQPIFTDFASI